MTKQQEDRLMEARRAIRSVLDRPIDWVQGIKRAGEGIEYYLTEPYQDKLIEEFLDLRDDGGNRIIGMIDSNQNLPNKDSNHTWYEDDYGEAGRMGYDLAIQDIWKEGWRKLIPEGE